MPSTQSHRQIAIQTPMGEDFFLLRAFTLQDQLSSPFVIEAEVLCEAENEVDFDAVVGHEATIRLSVANEKDRFFCGVVSRLVQVSNRGIYSRYQATIVPWLWLLTRTSDCRIYQEMTVPDIIKAVFSRHGFKNFQDHTTGTPPTLEYVVQYRETDFNFISRLLEQEGIFYFFTHENGKETLVLADSISAIEPFEGYEAFEFNELSQGSQLEETVFDWSHEFQIQPVKYSLSDYNFTMPRTSLATTNDSTHDHGQARFEIFDYPGNYPTVGIGDEVVKKRLQELDAQRSIYKAQSTVRGAGVGHKFSLKQHRLDSQNKDYTITSLVMQVDGGDFESSSENDSKFFSCSFQAIPQTTIPAPRRTTPKPVIQGPQTALVVGKSGEEIYTDKYGRVKVAFYWDRYHIADENASCWVRVSQAWAGNKYGIIFTPRIGQEVIVEFLEGDPDRPIITGRVYNAAQTTPYPLPDEATKSTIKTSSSKGGAGFNEIRFEDKKGDEQIFIHGEKNLDVRIKNDTYEWQGNDRHLLVKNDHIESIENDHHEKIKRDHVVEIGRDHHTKIKGKEAIEVTGTHSIKVTGDVTEEFAANQSTQVTKNLYIKAENIVIEATKNITINVGESFIAIESSGIKIATNGDIAIEAKKNISQKATMDWKTEATMNASIKGTIALKAEGGATAELKSPMSTVKGDGMLILQGGLVKIN